MNNFCEGCEPNTICTRHKLFKNSRKVELCKGIANTEDGGLKYWNAWEQGLSGATAPEEPKLNPDGFVQHVIVNSANQTKISVLNRKNREVSKIGDRLKRIIEKKTGAAIPCGECKKHLMQLNEMTPKEARENRSDIVQKIAARARKESPKFWQMLAVAIDQALHIGETERKIGSWLDEAIKEEEEEQSKEPELLKRSLKGTLLKWAYGITTVPSRLDDLFPRTLESLQNAGFDKPVLFVDGEKDASKYESFGLEITTHYPVLRTYGNWILALWELYIRNPAAERYAVFQDDFVTYKNLVCYLDECQYPEKGYWNLYTFPENQELAPENGTGWYESNQWGRGAVALIFSREAVKTLLSQRYMVDRPEDVKRGWKAVDGGVISAFKNIGWKEYVHNPSLVQHTGKISSMKNSPHKEANSFRGESFDALELLNPVYKKGLGDKIEGALTTIGITDDRVSGWLGRPCGCKERKEKLNQLGRWATRILAGNTHRANEYLDEILEQ